ncbi:helix-turn-helix transcriptional regulator [Nitrogeniibacter aestuarii]|uniref:helix-turn-helix transcriptional regulator n=1 Tax=Nitrogeniibacter aestuarii TaxID=2815343 RepID=UPI001D0FF102|nr:hypothetical protein [Nitrogeniibacter aestuarii]
MSRKHNISIQAIHFDRLADSNLVDINTVTTIEGCCRATIYNRIKAGSFPSPEPGTGKNRWLVGKIRAFRKTQQDGQ